MTRTQNLLFRPLAFAQPEAAPVPSRPAARLFWMISLVVTAAALPALGDDPCVRFDMVQAVAVTDVSSPEFVAVNPFDKLIHIELSISSLARPESEGVLQQFLYIISGTTTGPFQVVDYAPKTTLFSETDGLVSVEESQSNTTTLGIKALTPGDFPLNGDAVANHNASSSNSTHSQRLPPRQLLVASGTMHRGVSAYFKIKSSTQTTLEGDKVFQIVAQVPRSWRAGLIHVSCTALSRTHQASVFSSDEAVCSRDSFMVGLHLAGDEAAQQAVRKLATTQRQLKYLAHVHAERIQGRMYAGVAHKVRTALLMTKPRIPEGWLREILTSMEGRPFEQYLPSEIQSATNQYRQTLTAVLDLAS